jgi:hypothetical protein
MVRLYFALLNFADSDEDARGWVWTFLRTNLEQLQMWEYSASSIIQNNVTKKRLDYNQHDSLAKSNIYISVRYFVKKRSGSGTMQSVYFKSDAVHRVHHTS